MNTNKTRKHRLRLAYHMPVEPENTIIVCEFQDVFLDDLPRLPPHREIEFVIELAPSTEPVSRAPYRMALVELKELKIQLQ